MKRFISSVVLLILALALVFCETIPEKKQATPEKKELTPMEKLTELAKGAVVINIYSIIQGAVTITPPTRVSIINIETKQVYESRIMNKGLNVFLNIPPGDYRLHRIFYEDPLIYPVLNVLVKTVDDKKVKLPDQKTEKLEDDDLYLLVKPRKLQYGGDYSIYIQKNMIKTAPPDFEKELVHMKSGSEIILAEFPHSRWAVEAMKILELENSY